MPRVPAPPIGTVASVQTGRIAPLGPDGVPSAFVKAPVAGAVRGRGTRPGRGDEQADRTVHGGPEKAVYGYAGRHYPAWAADYPGHADLFRPGGFGAEPDQSMALKRRTCASATATGSAAPCCRSANLANHASSSRCVSPTTGCRRRWCVRSERAGTTGSWFRACYRQATTCSSRIGQILDSISAAWFGSSTATRRPSTNSRRWATMAGLASSLRSDAQRRLDTA